MRNTPSIADKLIAVLDGLTIDEATRELNNAINVLQTTQIVRCQVRSVGPEETPKIKAPKSSVTVNDEPIPGTG